LRTIAPPGAARLEGADATHAWVQVWCGPDFGWLGLDPTNALAEGDAHIVIGVGRDYADVAPLDGVIVTHGAQALDVAVDVTPVSA
jgi:transglutaminase-like putative cysteine protease